MLYLIHAPHIVYGFKAIPLDDRCKLSIKRRNKMKKTIWEKLSKRFKDEKAMQEAIVRGIRDSLMLIQTIIVSGLFILSFKTLSM